MLLTSQARSAIRSMSPFMSPESLSLQFVIR